MGDPTDLATTDTQMRAEVLMVANLNQVSGSPLGLDSEDIAFGRVTGSPGGQFTFHPTSNGKVDENTDSVTVTPMQDDFPLAFGNFVGRSSLDVGARASAMVRERDIVLVLDRSSSMLRRDAGFIDIADFPPNLKAVEDALFGPDDHYYCLLYTSPSPRDATLSRMPSSA